MNKSTFGLLVCCCVLFSGCLQGLENHDRFTMGGPIFWGASTGHASTVKESLSAGACVNSINANGDTPLILAVANNQVEIVRILLSAGANPSIKNTSGESALDIARSKNDQAILNMITAGNKQPPRTPSFFKGGKWEPNVINQNSPAPSLKISNQQFVGRFRCVMMRRN